MSGDVFGTLFFVAVVVVVVVVVSMWGFLSQTLAIQRTAGERRGPYFILLYEFRPLTNLQTFITLRDDYHRLFNHKA